MELKDTLLDAIKKDKVIFGYRKSIRFIKTKRPKLIVMAENAPEEVKRQVEHSAKVFNLKVKVFSGSSRELGVVCGKPFPVSVLVIKE